MDRPRLNPDTGGNESVIGTGFWFFGEQLHSPVDIRQDEADRLDNMVDVFSKAFLGLTVACARCHDHKFDAISTKDYYSLLGFLESGNYRQVRFDTCEEHGRLAADLHDLRKRHEAALRRDIAAALRPGVKRLAESLMDGKGRWAAAIKAAATDPSDPLYAWAFATEKRGEFGARIEQVRKRTTAAGPDRDVPLAATVVAPPWIPDGTGFETVPAGGAIFGADPRKPIVGISERAAVAFDPVWNVRAAAPHSEDEPGDLAKMHRAGRMVRTPSFTISSDHFYYLIRGRGHAFACVDSYLMLEGPLHRMLVQPVLAESEYRWVPHDVSRYRGQICHVEFSPDRDAEFAVAAVVQSDRPPAVSIRKRGFWEMRTSAWHRPQTWRRPISEVCLQALDFLANDRKTDSPTGPGLIRMADWLMRHSDLFTGEIQSKSIDVFLAEQSKLLRACIANRVWRRPCSTARAWTSTSSFAAIRRRPANWRRGGSSKHWSAPRR